MSVKYESHFAVYALILNEKKDSVLLIKKGLGCYTGLYDLPGGTMEPHELLLDTLKREVKEETNCSVTAAKQLITLSILYPHIKQGKKLVLRHIGAIYTATVEGRPRNWDAGVDDSRGCFWIPLSQISNENATPFVMEAIGFLSTC